MRLGYALAVGLVLAASAATAPVRADHELTLPGLGCPANASAMARLELYFGASRPGGASVTDAEWKAFLDAEVTPRFPDGLTVLAGYGQWRNGAGVIVQEGSRVLVVLYQPKPETESAIEAIRSAYKSRFQQESVMRIDSPSCVSF